VTTEPDRLAGAVRRDGRAPRRDRAPGAAAPTASPALSRRPPRPPSAERKPRPGVAAPNRVTPLLAPFAETAEAAGDDRAFGAAPPSGITTSPPNTAELAGAGDGARERPTESPPYWRRSPRLPKRRAMTAPWAPHRRAGSRRSPIPPNSRALVAPGSGQTESPPLLAPFVDTAERRTETRPGGSPPYWHRSPRPPSGGRRPCPARRSSTGSRRQGPRRRASSGWPRPGAANGVTPFSGAVRRDRRSGGRRPRLRRRSA
jgi:hypothetical protein